MLVTVNGDNVLCISPGTACGNTQRLLVGLSEAADAKDDGDHDQSHGGGQHHVQPEVEVGTLRQTTHLEYDMFRILEYHQERFITTDLFWIVPVVSVTPRLLHLLWPGRIATIVVTTDELHPVLGVDDELLPPRLAVEP